MKGPLETEIDNIWNKHKENIPKYNEIILSPKYKYKVSYKPANVSEEQIKCNIIFVGLNPSFNEIALNKVLKEKGINKSAIEIFDFENREKQIEEGKYKGKTFRDIINEIDEESVKEYDYFGDLRKYADKYNYSFDYYDIFLYRLTEQKILEKYIKSNVKFFGEQIDFFIKNVLNANSDKRFFFLNAFALEIIKESSKNKNERKYFSDYEFKNKINVKEKEMILVHKLCGNNRNDQIDEFFKYIWQINK